MTFTDENDTSMASDRLSIDSEQSLLNTTRASKVFGDLVMDEGDSLCYSPSPMPDKSGVMVPRSATPKKFTFNETSKSTEDTSTTRHPLRSITVDKNSMGNRTSSKNVKAAYDPPKKKKKMKVKSSYRGRPLSSRNRDLVKKTQSAINEASNSVNATLNAAKISKKIAEQNRLKRTERLKEELKAEKEEAKAFYTEAERTQREILEMRSQFNTKFRREKANRERKGREAKRHAIEKELNFKSSVFRDHQRSLKEEESRRKRMSMAARAKLRQNKREGEERMRMARIEEEKAVIEERHKFSLAKRESEQVEAERRRKSYAFRNAEGARQREKMDELKAVKQHEEHESYELKWAGEKDAEEYKKQLEEQRRDSFAFRNAEGARQREKMDELKAVKQHEEHESYELKWAGEKDAEEYKKQLEEQRRDSFAFRNAEGVRHRAVMDELLALAKEQETESLMLKWAGEKDAKAYLADQAELRRKSLQHRNEEGRRHREMDEEKKIEEVQQAAAEEKLQAECHQDVEDYKARCAARDRASLCYRQKEARIHRLEAEHERQEQLEVQAENEAIAAADRRDVEKYLDDCKKRERLSLAYRAKEKRQHDEWEKREAEKQRDQRSHDTRMRAIDHRYSELEKQRERAQAALDAHRHAGCTFAVNPFSSLLD